MEKLFHKINKYSYKLGNSIESNDIQKIDIYTKHHIHHFEQCGKAIILSGGNMAEFTIMLREYIDHVDALVADYSAKLQEIEMLKQEKYKLDAKIQNIFVKQDPLMNEADAKEATIIELTREFESLKARKEAASSVGGSIKNNNKINGAKHDMHYIQQYGKAIIQSGGTIGELKANLEGYIAAVAQFLDKYNRMMQEYYAVTNAVKKSNAIVLEVQAKLDELHGSNATAQQVIELLQSQIVALRVELGVVEEEEGLEEVVEEVVEEVGLKEEVVTIKSLINTMCNADMDRNKSGECHKSLQRIDKALRRKFNKPDEAFIFGYNDNDTREFYKLIKNNKKDEFINLLKSNEIDKKGETLLQLIRLNNIKSILQGKKVNIKRRETTKQIDVLDGQFYDANSLLTNNDDAIAEIASFFYEKPIHE